MFFLRWVVVLLLASFLILCMLVWLFGGTALPFNNIFDLITRNAGAAISFLSGVFVGIFPFFYRLIGGEYVVQHLTVELSCENPLENWQLVRSTIKITNSGTTTLRINDAKFSIFQLGSNGVPLEPWFDPETKISRPHSEERRADDRKASRGWRVGLHADGKTHPTTSKPIAPVPQVELKLHELDFQRISVHTEKTQKLWLGRLGQLRQLQAEHNIQWLNLDSKSTLYRQFIRSLDRGMYKFEFRIVTTPIFGEDAARLIPSFIRSNPWFSPARFAQSSATAVIMVEPRPKQANSSKKDEQRKSSKAGEIKDAIGDQKNDETGEKDGTAVPRIGILAYGSLIDDPGPEIATAIVERRHGITTPFKVEYARTSRRWGDGPTLVPVHEGGAQVTAVILLLRADITERQARDMLWRRETSQVGTYDPAAKPGPDTVRVGRVENFCDVAVVLYAKIPADIVPSSGNLANAAIASAQSEELVAERDGISYLMRAKANGIVTPLSEEYENEIMKLCGAPSLGHALKNARSRKLKLSSGAQRLSQDSQRGKS